MLKRRQKTKNIHITYIIQRTQAPVIIVLTTTVIAILTHTTQPGTPEQPV